MPMSMSMQEMDPSERPTNFIPKNFDSLRQVIRVHAPGGPPWQDVGVEHGGRFGWGVGGTCSFFRWGAERFFCLWLIARKGKKTQSAVVRDNSEKTTTALSCQHCQLVPPLSPPSAPFRLAKGATRVRNTSDLSKPTTLAYYLCGINTRRKMARPAQPACLRLHRR